MSADAMRVLFLQAERYVAAKHMWELTDSGADGAWARHGAMEDAKEALARAALDYAAWTVESFREASKP